MGYNSAVAAFAVWSWSLDGPAARPGHIVSPLMASASPSAVVTPAEFRAAAIHAVLAATTDTMKRSPDPPPEATQRAYAALNDESARLFVGLSPAL